jgi:glycosyltransferase involved in cell wall biosynthesis
VSPPQSTSKSGNSPDPELFSVVIPAHNAEAYIDAQLAALAAQVDAPQFEVIVVDNMSTDRTADRASQYADRLELRIVAATNGRGAAYARNVGVENARGSYIVFIDADDVADASLLAAYGRHAHTYRIMGGRYEETRLNDPRVAAWRYRLTEKGLPIAFGKIRFFLMGNVAIHSSVFEAIGNFDETLTHGGEEVEFAARASLAGYEVEFVEDAIVYYRHRETLRGLSRQFFDYGRATTYVFARYRQQAALRHTSAVETVRLLWKTIPYVVNVARGNARRGQWIRMTSFLAGEMLESGRRRVWHIG